MADQQRRTLALAGILLLIALLGGGGLLLWRRAPPEATPPPSMAAGPAGPEAAASAAPPAAAAPSETDKGPAEAPAPAAASEEPASPAPEADPPAEHDPPTELWLAGRVLGPDGGPAADAEVSLHLKRIEAPSGSGGGGNPVLNRMSEIARIEAEDDGTYAMRLPERFPFAAIAQAPGAAPASAMLRTGTIRISTTSDGRRVVWHDFQLGPGRALEGRTVDPGGAPVSGVSVELALGLPSNQAFDLPVMPLQTESDEEGRFTFPGISLGDRSHLVLRKEGFAAVKHSVPKDEEARDYEISPFGGTIEGRVLQPPAAGEAAVPVAGAEVTAYTALPQNYLNLDPVAVAVQSGADGGYTLRPLEDGNWHVLAVDPGPPVLGLRGVVMEDLALGVEQIREGHDLVLPAPVLVHGKVMHAETDEALGGVRIQRIDPATGEEFDGGETAADGTFELGVLAVDEKLWGRLRSEVTFAKEGYASTGLGGDVPPIEEGAIYETYKMMPEPEYVMVRGRVVDHNGAPVSDVLVTGDSPAVERSRTMSGAGGRFALPLVANSIAKLKAIPESGSPSYHPAFAVEEEDVEGIEFVLDPGGTLELLVVDPDGQALAGADAWFMRRTYWDVERDGGGTSTISSASRIEWGVTNEDGLVRWDGIESTGAVLEHKLESGRASVDAGAEHPDYDEVEERGLEIKPGEVNRHVLTMLGKDDSGVMEGTIVDAQTGEPIEGVMIQAHGARVQAQSDALGFFRLEGLRPKEWLVQFDHPGYKIFSEKYAFSAFDVEIELEPRDGAP